jgi:hypothetical protein
MPFGLKNDLSWLRKMSYKISKKFITNLTKINLGTHVHMLKKKVKKSTIQFCKR